MNKKKIYSDCNKYSDRLVNEAYSKLLCQFYDVSGTFGKNGKQGIIGTNGNNGTKGNTNNIGDKGYTESNGKQGDSGSEGSVGDIGSDGNKGDIGKIENGDKGYIGIKGDTGIKGDKGNIGTNGGDGNKGTRGDIGTRGDKGINGSKGNNAIVGDLGIKGDKGIIGDKGNQGDLGSSEINGSNGKFGDPGNSGTKGMTGSADKGNIGNNGDSGTAFINSYGDAINNSDNIVVKIRSGLNISNLGFFLYPTVITNTNFNITYYQGITVFRPLIMGHYLITYDIKADQNINKYTHFMLTNSSLQYSLGGICPPSNYQTNSFISFNRVFITYLYVDDYYLAVYDSSSAFPTNQFNFLGGINGPQITFVRIA